MRFMSGLVIAALVISIGLPALGGQCESNYKSLGSVWKGKSYGTYADYPGLDPHLALERLSISLAAEGFVIESADEASGTIKALARLGPGRTAPVEVKALPIEGGTRVEFTIDLPRGAFGNAATKAAICRFVDLARVDPANRYQHPLLAFIRTNASTPDKVAVVESSTKRRLGKMALGALGGALLGAAQAKLTGGDVAKNAAIGAVAGAAIVFGITRIQDKRLADREAVMAAESYDPNQGYRTGIRSVTVTPETVKPGETIKVVTTYWALTPGETETLGVYRYAAISLSGSYLRGFRFNPEPFQFGNGGGEFETTMEVQLPQSVSPGSYSVQWVVDGQSTGADVEAVFTVAG